MPRHSRALPTPGATTLLAAAERCHPTCRRAAHHPSAIVHLIFQLMLLYEMTDGEDIQRLASCM
ncbi:Os11g0435350 [Oryza sativa Japonica Group]|uniref:Os11g0435350 protein n=3 Tax=Oryza TaxID=4527 RepID=C7J8M3_ORYSJ|nr:Os11g0435350 [Oryza sativa Japonica Group]|eukprot:NP_001176514.1 Os11g0435350 [Oryza sativa Japonica Group]